MRKKIVLPLLVSLLLTGCEFTPSLSSGASQGSESGNSASSSSPISSSESISQITYLTVLFNTDGGSEVASQSIEEGYLIEKPEDPTKTGYTFTSWYLEDLITEWDFTTGVVVADMTLYAVWSVNEYTVSFESNGGSFIDTITANFGDAINEATTPSLFGYRFAGWCSDIALTTPFILTDVMPAFTGTLYAKWEVETFNLPVLMIDLNEDISLVNREDYVRSRISLMNVDTPYTLSQVGADFRGRGNGSWDAYEQKSYRIKFDSKIALFGEPLSKHWVIVPGANDFSSTRNNAAFTITANVLSNIEYTSSVHIVEVYINGNYHGVYSVLEQVRVADDRVNIASDYGVLDTGYLVEYDAYAEGTQGIYNFAINGLKYKFSMKSPDPDEYAASVTETVYRSQVTYIQNYMQQLTTAILRRNYSTILSLVDINSVVDMYIIHELFKNTDTGWSSFFMYKKPGDKVFFGPIWDFDFSAGISRGDSSTSGLYVSDTVRNYSDFTSSEMYISLMRIASFVSLVKARYIAIHNQITQQINAVFDEASHYTESYARDATQWTWHYNWESDQIYVKNWLLTRNDWMYNWAGGQ